MADFEDIISSITSNPDIMSKISEIAKSKGDGTDPLPDVMAAIAPLMNSKKSENDKKDGEEEAEKIPASVINSLAGGTAGSSASLLKALKPFVNSERKDLIDKITRISGIAELVKKVR